jgi:UDP-N-acetyl-D-glucosamine dehydrogenase
VLKEFEDKIKNKELKIGVIGLGYVGLPLAAAFAKKGFSVTGIDLDKKKVSSVRRGRSYVLDVPSADIHDAVKRRLLRATSDYKALAPLDAVIICVPTPWSKKKEPDISFIVDAAKRIAGCLKKGQLVVLESTTYPGTTDEVLLPMFERSGLRAEKDFYLAFSPERVDPGNRNFEVTAIPKVVGGVGKESSSAAKSLYEIIMERTVVVSSAKTAEMVKLLENTFRSVNIGLINEIAVMSNRLGIDIWEVIEAAKTKPFGFMPFYPGPGLGGHCIPIDPLYLSWKSRLHGYEAKMIELASSISETMPQYVVERVSRLLNLKKIPLKNARVLVLGAAYKKNIDDIRESPALEVMEKFLEEGAGLSYSDPYVPSVKLSDRSLKSQKLTPALLNKQHCVVVLTDHAAFDGEMIVRYSKLILDTRNFLRNFAPAKKQNLFFL